jgi:hypothetical protein
VSIRSPEINGAIILLYACSPLFADYRMAGVACQENGMKKLVEKTGSNFQIIQ